MEAILNNSVVEVQGQGANFVDDCFLVVFLCGEGNKISPLLYAGEFHLQILSWWFCVALIASQWFASKYSLHVSGLGIQHVSNRDSNLQSVVDSKRFDQKTDTVVVEFLPPK